LHDDITRIFARPFSVDGREIVAEIKSGVACYPDDGHEPHELVQNAEAALKEAKTSANAIWHHRIEMNSELARRVGMEHRLRTALEKGAVPAALPAQDHPAHRRIAVWRPCCAGRDPENGLIAPAIFLPLLESGGLMGATGAWVLRQAASDCRAWRCKGLPPIRVAVNMSPRSCDNAILRAKFSRPSAIWLAIQLGGSTSRSPRVCFPATPHRASTRSGCCAPQAFALQLMTSVRASPRSAACRSCRLTLLRSTAYSPAACQRTAGACTLVSTIIGLAHAFDMTTVAEGVETQAQLDYLVREGCDESQGYLHSRPLPRSDLESWLIGVGSAATDGAISESARA